MIAQFLKHGATKAEATSEALVQVYVLTSRFSTYSAHVIQPG